MSVGVILENPDIDERKELLKEIIKGKEYNNLIKKNVKEFKKGHIIDEII